MIKIKDMTDQKFGKLTVMRLVKDPHPGAHWLCKCDCGNERVVAGYNLRSGGTKTCHQLGCGINLRHGHSANNIISPTYISWCAMKQRCQYKKHKFYHNYGGRGVTVCSRWNKFENFLKDMGDRPVDTSIDRIDNNGNYELGNCKWSLRKKQANNRRERLLF